MMLQAVQHGQNSPRWVLKGFHAGRLAALFAAYPDARVLYIHRDPVLVLASRIKLMMVLHEGLTGKPDTGEHSRIHRDASKAGFHATLDNLYMHDRRVQHAGYQDFSRDQVVTIRAFYDFAGQPWTEEAEGAMRHYLAANKGDRYGKFVCATDLIGGDIEDLHEEFAPYRERFGIDIERRG